MRVTRVSVERNADHRSLFFFATYPHLGFVKASNLLEQQTAEHAWGFVAVRDVALAGLRIDEASIEKVPKKFWTERDLAMSVQYCLKRNDLDLSYAPLVLLVSLFVEGFSPRFNTRPTYFWDCHKHQVSLSWPRCGFNPRC